MLFERIHVVCICEISLYEPGGLLARVCTRADIPGSNLEKHTGEIRSSLKKKERQGEGKGGAPSKQRQGPEMNRTTPEGTCHSRGIDISTETSSRLTGLILRVSLREPCAGRRTPPR